MLYVIPNRARGIDLNAGKLYAKCINREALDMLDAILAYFMDI